MKIALCGDTHDILQALEQEPYPVSFNDGEAGPCHIFPSQMTSILALKRLQDILSTFHFGNRRFIEHDAGKLQPLPYLILRDANNRILGYNRPDKTTETRLAGNFSIGLGGHIEPDDCGADSELLADYFHDNAIRELAEEILFENGAEKTNKIIGPVALIHDLSNDVGMHHLAVVYLVTITDEITLAEPIANAPDEVINLRWLTPAECANQPKPENWTKFLIEQFLPLLNEYPL